MKGNQHHVEVMEKEQEAKLQPLLIICPIAIAYSMGQIVQETHQEMK